MSQKELTKLRDFIKARLRSGVPKDVLSLELQFTLPPAFLTRAMFEEFDLPWAFPPAMESLSSLQGLTLSGYCLDEICEKPFNGLFFSDVT